MTVVNNVGGGMIFNSMCVCHPSDLIISVRHHHFFFLSHPISYDCYGDIRLPTNEADKNLRTQRSLGHIRETGKSNSTYLVFTIILLYSLFNFCVK